jgi:hypothetical protein
MGFSINFAAHPNALPVDAAGYLTAVKLITEPHLAPRFRMRAASLTHVFMTL